MTIKRVIGTIRAQDWPALFSELIIVVVGIFIAIQVDSWWQHQDDLRKEELYVSRLINDVERDTERINRSIGLAKYRLSLSDLLIEAALDPTVARVQPVNFITAVQQAAFTHTPSLNSDTFEELRSTGGLTLLRNDQLKSSLFEYYRYDQTQRQYLSLQLMTEFRHFELAAGVLSNDQYVWMQDEMGYVSPFERPDVTFTDQQMNALVEAAERLGNSPDLVAWLPESRSMQLELIATHESRLERANALLTVLRDY
jgi:hypothetical protein